MNAKLIWATPEGDQMLAYIARVSNPANQNSESVTKLLKYMMREGHVSPFEMANACIEINCARDIARQILRHRSFSFQEFSQRYQSIDELPTAELREARLQDTKNRQNSIETDDVNLQKSWEDAQAIVHDTARMYYQWALDNGIAKEVARSVLPEGLTPSRIYMNGTLRSWIFYLKQRLHPSTQKEHRVIAEEVFAILADAFPITMQSAFAELFNE